MAVISFVKTPIEHINYFVNPRDRNQTKRNLRALFTHNQFKADLRQVFANGFTPVSLEEMGEDPSHFHLQIFEQFSPEAGLKLARAVHDLRRAMDRAIIPVTFVVRADSETYDLKEEAAAFRRMIDLYGVGHVTLGLQFDGRLLEGNAETAIRNMVAQTEDLLDHRVRAISIADGPSHHQAFVDREQICGLINLNHTRYTRGQETVIQGDATGGWWGPYGSSVAKAREAGKPLLWRSSTGQWITPKPMTAYEALWQYGEQRFPKQFFAGVQAGKRFIMGEPGSMVVKREYQFMYGEGWKRTPLPKPHA